MIHKNLNDIELKDIEVLIENKVPENRTLEYKREFSNKDSDKTKFLCEVCALANTSGGDLIYGVKEDSERVPESTSPLNIVSIDEFIQKLNNVIITGIEPRLSKIDIKPIEVSESNYIIIIRIGKSWNSPHRVLKNKEFYGRNTSGKYPMDILEIRNAINLSGSIIESIKKFRTDRLIRIAGNETPVKMEPGGKLVLHILPVSAFHNKQQISVHKNENELQKFSPLGVSRGMSYKSNLAGYICFQGGNTEKSRSYTQIYRNGSIESCISFTQSGDDKRIPVQYLERQILKNSEYYIKKINDLEIDFPFFIFISCLSVKNYVLSLSDGIYSFMENEPFNEDFIDLPECLLESFEQNLSKTLKPAFDVLYNAFGILQSYSISENGDLVD